MSKSSSILQMLEDAGGATATASAGPSSPAAGFGGTVASLGSIPNPVIKSDDDEVEGGKKSKASKLLGAIGKSIKSGLKAGAEAPVEL